MGFFDFLKGEPSYTLQQIMAKGMAAIQSYQYKDFSKAAELFEEYLNMKGFGKYPQLDADDWGMRLNLMVCLLYSRKYKKCIETCNTLMRINPNGGDAYAFSALSHYKLGNVEVANKLWKIAKTKGSQLANSFDMIEDVRMEGFNA